MAEQLLFYYYYVLPAGRFALGCLFKLFSERSRGGGKRERKVASCQIQVTLHEYRHSSHPPTLSSSLFALRRAFFFLACSRQKEWLCRGGGPLQRRESAAPKRPAKRRAEGNRRSRIQPSRGPGSRSLAEWASLLESLQVHTCAEDGRVLCGLSSNVNKRLGEANASWSGDRGSSLEKRAGRETCLWRQPGGASFSPPPTPGLKGAIPSRSKELGASTLPREYPSGLRGGSGKIRFPRPKIQSAKEGRLGKEERGPGGRGGGGEASSPAS